MENLVSKDDPVTLVTPVLLVLQERTEILVPQELRESLVGLLLDEMECPEPRETEAGMETPVEMETPVTLELPEPPERREMLVSTETLVSESLESPVDLVCPELRE